MGAQPVYIDLPVRREQITRLQPGDEVLLSGTMLAGRDQVHKRFYELLEAGKPLPVDIRGETIFYMGPAPAPEGAVIGSCGPTTSARMDPFTPRLLAAGLRGMIGKGPRSSSVREAVRETGSIYFYAYGGCGALYAGRIVAARPIAFPELGPEALLALTVTDFPVLVAMDCRGNVFTE